MPFLTYVVDKGFDLGFRSLYLNDRLLSGFEPFDGLRPGLTPVIFVLKACNST